MITAKNFWFWFGGIWSAVGAVFLVVGIAVGTQRLKTNARLEAEGRPATGIVLSKDISRSSENSSATYSVEFRFVTERGDTVLGDADLPADVWDALEERGPIELSYLPDTPDTHRVAGQSDGVVLALVFSAGGAAIGGLGAFVLISAVRRRRREAELGRSGLTTEAAVLDVAPGNMRINGVPQWKLRYQYHDARGQAHEGSYTLSPQEAAAWQQGERGRVRYDPRNPRSHVWMGKT